MEPIGLVAKAGLPSKVKAQKTKRSAQKGSETIPADEKDGFREISNPLKVLLSSRIQAPKKLKGGLQANIRNPRYYCLPLIRSLH